MSPKQKNSVSNKNSACGDEPDKKRSRAERINTVQAQTPSLTSAQTTTAAASAGLSKNVGTDNAIDIQASSARFEQQLKIDQAFNIMKHTLKTMHPDMTDDELRETFARSMLSTNIPTPKKLFDLVPIAEDFTMVDGVSHAFAMAPLIKYLPAVAGLSGFADYLSKKVRGLFGGVQELQDTRAIVVKNASGVGKTVGSIAVCWNLSQRSPDVLFVPLYLGFNSGFELTGPETALLQENTINSFERVARVVGRRLLLQLQTLIRECEQSTDPKAALESVLRPDGSWQARMPLPTNMRIFKSAKRFTDDFGTLEEECAALIKELLEYCGGKGLAVLLIVDEGQRLDEYIAPAAGDSGGARCALRFGRHVQLLVSRNAVTGSPKMCALPIMTGIDPTTSLSTITDGSNEEYVKVLHTREEFVEVLKIINVRKIQFSELKYELLAAVFYPVARDAKWFYNSSNISKEEGEQVKDGREATVPTELAPLMLMARGVGRNLVKSLWHPAVPAAFEVDGFVPMPSCFRITSYIQKCSWIQREANLDWKPIDGLDDLSGINRALSLNADGFEAACGRIFTLILALANIPYPAKCPDDWNPTYPHDAILREYTAAQGQLRAMDPWFVLPCALTNIQEPVELKEAAKQVFLPSSVNGTTAEAFRLNANGTPAHGFFRDVKGAVDKLTNKGECYVLRCEGSAPVDFIFVILLSDRVQANADEMKRNTKASDKLGCEVAIRLMDVKHSNSKAPPLGAKEFSEMVGEFQLVANYLCAALKAECGMRVAEEKSAIFTNQRPTGPEVATQSISTNWTAASGGTHTVSVLSPKTFTFPPLTGYLYAWRS